MLIRVPDKNYESVGITHFASDGQLESKEHTVIASMFVGIPLGMGDMAAAAMIKGLNDFLLQHVLTSYSQDTKEAVESAEKTIDAFLKRIGKKSDLILP